MGCTPPSGSALVSLASGPWDKEGCSGLAPGRAPCAAALEAHLVARGQGLGILVFKISAICSRILASLLNPFLLLRASLIYGISSENNVQKGVCRAGCAKAINPDSSLVPLKGFWEPNIRYPREKRAWVVFQRVLFGFIFLFL